MESEESVQLWEPVRHLEEEDSVQLGEPVVQLEEESVQTHAQAAIHHVAPQHRPHSNHWKSKI